MRRAKIWMEAMKSQAVADAMVCSKSLASRRFRLSQGRIRSTTKRRGSTSKPLAASERLMIAMGAADLHEPRDLQQLSVLYGECEPDYVSSFAIPEAVHMRGVLLSPTAGPILLTT